MFQNYFHKNLQFYYNLEMDVKIQYHILNNEETCHFYYLPKHYCAKYFFFFNDLQIGQTIFIFENIFLLLNLNPY